MCFFDIKREFESNWSGADKPGLHDESLGRTFTRCCRPVYQYSGALAAIFSHPETTTNAKVMLKLNLSKANQKAFLETRRLARCFSRAVVGCERV